MSPFKTFFAAAGAALALSGAANAALYSVRDNPANGSSVFATGLGRSVSINYMGTSSTVGAGVFSLQFGNDRGWTDFLTFCLQLSERLTLPKEHQLIDGDAYFPNAANRTALEILYANFMNSGLGLKDATSAAAMQTIIWEVIEDGAANFNLTSGAFRLYSADVRDKANAFWNLILTGQLKPVKFNVLSARGTQDLIVTEVPIPGGIFLFGSAVAGFAFARRQKKG